MFMPSPHQTLYQSLIKDRETLHLYCRSPLMLMNIRCGSVSTQNEERLRLEKGLVIYMFMSLYYIYKMCIYTFHYDIWRSPVWHIILGGMINNALYNI